MSKDLVINAICPVPGSSAPTVPPKPDRLKTVRFGDSLSPGGLTSTLDPGSSLNMSDGDMSRSMLSPIGSRRSLHDSFDLPNVKMGGSRGCGKTYRKSSSSENLSMRGQSSSLMSPSSSLCSLPPWPRSPGGLTAWTSLCLCQLGEGEERISKRPTLAPT